SFGAKAYRVDDVLDLALRLGADGKAMRGAKVQATVFAPRQGVGTLLATKRFSAESSAGHTEPGLTAAQRRIEALLLDKGAHAALRPVGHRVAMSDRGDGLYGASFRGVTVPGIYTVVFEVEARLPKGGEIHRTETRSMLVRFGRADAKTSGLAVELLGTGAAQREMVIRVRPRDTHGN